MKKNYYAIIMAGGMGTRFFPVSTEQHPKQFHDILGTGETLIQKTFHRINHLIPTENIRIATQKCYKNIVLEQLPKVKKEQLVLEPTMRNTAPCILYNILKIYKENPNAVILIAPSDHWIEKEVVFTEHLQSAFEFTSKNKVLLTLGIQPNNANTGYGYIQFEKTEKEFKKVISFTEKPSLEVAKSFLEKGNYLWNAGIFVWSAKSILQAFEKHLPTMFSLFSNGNERYNTDDEETFINEIYPKSENISIDFGIMEKAENVFVLPTDIGWSDLGTWDSLYEKKEKDAMQNATINGTVFYQNASKNIVNVSKNKKVVIQGLSDYIVVEKEDILFICPKEKSQEIKQLKADTTTFFEQK